MVQITARLQALREAEGQEGEEEGARLLLQVHDELLYEVRKDFLPTALPIIRAGMQDCASLRVPLLVRLQVGPDWGHLQPMDAPMEDTGGNDI